MPIDKKKEYYKRLRKIVLRSAHELPAEIEHLLNQVLEHGRRERVEEVYKNFHALTEARPEVLVDFVLTDLINDVDVSRRRDSLDYPNKLGIGDTVGYTFFPPAHTQGPFLYLLQQDESEGLRLIHELVNTALDRRQEFLSDPHRRGHGQKKPQLHLHPISIDLHDRSQKFYGDEVVYCWFRPYARDPKPVICALMALEYWLEQRVEAGEDPKDLFSRVLQGSRCIALPAICLGVSFAFPGKCLEAAFPFISSSAIWRLDIKRYATDLTNTYAGMGLNTHQRMMYKLQAQRQERPQRRIDIRGFAMRYMFSEDKLRDRFMAAADQFAENPPFIYKEEKDHPDVVDELKKDAKKYALIADPDRYRFEEADEGILISVEPPEPIKQEEQEAQERLEEQMQATSLFMWAFKAFDQGALPETMDVPEVMNLAKERYESLDLESKTEDGFLLPDDLGAIGAPAAALSFAFNEVEQIGEVEWCQKILLNASHLEIGASSTAGYTPGYYAAHGLCALVANGHETGKIRSEVLRLITLKEDAVFEAVFQWMDQIWETDQTLFWNCLSLGLTCGSRPPYRRSSVFDGFDDFKQRKTSRIKEALDAHIANLEQESNPSYPEHGVIEEGFHFLWGRALPLLEGLPIEKMVAGNKGEKFLFALTDELMEWTIERNESGHGSYRADHPPTQWNRSFLNWTSRLGKHLSSEETEQHILRPVYTTWPDVGNLVFGLLDGYISHNIATTEQPQEESVQQWNEVCSWVIDELQNTDWSHRRWLPNELREAAGLVVFCRNGRCLIKDSWKHAPLFENTISEWVDAIGFRPETYSDLIELLEGPGSCFLPRPGLEWIEYCREQSDNTVWDERSNAQRTSQLLDELHEDEGDVMNDAELRLLSSLVDELVSFGTPLAHVIQQKLEHVG